MPLLDVFRPPASRRVVWTSFHATWAVELMAWLNAHLDPRYQANVQVNFGVNLAADVAERDTGAAESPNGQTGGLAVQNMNLMLGFPETTGLEQVALFP